LVNSTIQNSIEPKDLSKVSVSSSERRRERWGGRMLSEWSRRRRNE